MGFYIDGYLEILKDRCGKWKNVGCIPDDQSYDTFAILGNVRNYVNAESITDSRGIPEDTSNYDELQELDNHINNFSFSWIDYSDIEEYDWSQEFIDGRTRTINKVKERLHNKIKAIDCLTKDWNKFIFVKMKKLAEKYGNKNIRIVFWFY